MGVAWPDRIHRLCNQQSVISRLVPFFALRQDEPIIAIQDQSSGSVKAYTVLRL